MSGGQSPESCSVPTEEDRTAGCDRRRRRLLPMVEAERGKRLERSSTAAGRLTSDASDGGGSSGGLTPEPLKLERSPTADYVVIGERDVSGFDVRFVNSPVGTSGGGGGPRRERPNFLRSVTHMISRRDSRRRASSDSAAAAAEEEAKLKRQESEEVINAIRELQNMANVLCDRLERIKVEKKRSRSRCLPSIPPLLIKYLFPFCILWQAAALAIVTVVEMTFGKRITDAATEMEVTVRSLTLAMMGMFEALNLVFIVLTSIKLWKQYMHQTARPSFLFQSYMASTLLFAGLYTIIAIFFDVLSAQEVFSGLARENISYRRFAAGLRDDIATPPPDRALSDGFPSVMVDGTQYVPLQAVAPLCEYGLVGGGTNATGLGADLTLELFGQLLFYSISTATLCGSSSISPLETIVYVLSGIQMTMSFVYFSAILGQFITEWKSETQADDMAYEFMSNKNAERFLYPEKHPKIAAVVADTQEAGCKQSDKLPQILEASEDAVDNYSTPLANGGASASGQPWPIVRPPWSPFGASVRRRQSGGDFWSHHVDNPLGSPTPADDEDLPFYVSMLNARGHLSQLICDLAPPHIN